MKRIKIVVMSAFLFFGCANVKNAIVDTNYFHKSQTYILAQIEGVVITEGKGLEIFFTPIQFCGINGIKPIRIDGEPIEPSKFYVKLVENKFTKGVMERALESHPKTYIESNEGFLKTKSIKKSQIKIGDIYLLLIDSLKSNDNKLVIESLLKPNKVLFSDIKKLD
jgi:hypothetical protein